MLKPTMIIRTIVLIGLGCLGLAAALAVVPAFAPRAEMQMLISTLSDAFKLCLGALLALLNEHARRTRR
jgi:hypothetical protein